jgi:hypothetical protein
MTTYDETYKFFNTQNDKLYEMNMSISTNNHYRQLADMTTLGLSDINLLFQYANQRHNNNLPYDAFINEPIKNIFVYIPQNNLYINKLMVLSYDYVYGDKIERFDVVFDEKDARLWILFLVIIILINIFLVYFLRICFSKK